MILVFPSTHEAIASERVLTGVVPIELMPTPTTISAGCGIVIRIADVDLAHVRLLLDEAGRSYRAIEE